MLNKTFSEASNFWILQSFELSFGNFWLSFGKIIEFRRNFTTEFRVKWSNKKPECIILLCLGVPKSTNLMTFLRPKKGKRLKKCQINSFIVIFKIFSPYCSRLSYIEGALWLLLFHPQAWNEAKGGPKCYTLPFESPSFRSTGFCSNKRCHKICVTSRFHWKD